MKLRARLALGRWIRRWGRVHRTWTRLWRNHAPLRNDWLARSRLGRCCWRSRGRSRFCRNRGRRFGRDRRRRRRLWRRRHDHCGLLCLRRRRWRRDHHGGRRSRLLGFFCSRGRRRSNNRRRLTRRRHYNGALGNRSGRFDHGFFCGGRCRRRCGGRGRWLWLCRRRRRRGPHNWWCCRAGRRHGWTLQLLLPLLQQLHHVARFGDLGKINLGFDFRRCGPIPGGCRAGFGGKMASDLFRFIGLNGA